MAVVYAHLRRLRPAPVERGTNERGMEEVMSAVHQIIVQDILQAVRESVDERPGDDPIAAVMTRRPLRCGTKPSDRVIRIIMRRDRMMQAMRMDEERRSVVVRANGGLTFGSHPTGSIERAMEEHRQDQPSFRGRTHGALKRAFMGIRSGQGWMAPIDEDLSPSTSEDDLRLLDDACMYFTGVAIRIERLDDRIRITSDGYDRSIEPRTTGGPSPSPIEA